MIVLAVLAVLLVVSFFVKRYREQDVPQQGWRATSEVFRDPSTDRVLRVWVDRDGSRHYVPDGQQPPFPGT